MARSRGDDWERESEYTLYAARAKRDSAPDPKESTVSGGVQLSRLEVFGILEGAESRIGRHQAVFQNTLAIHQPIGIEPGRHREASGFDRHLLARPHESSAHSRHRRRPFIPQPDYVDPATGFSRLGGRGRVRRILPGDRASAAGG